MSLAIATGVQSVVARIARLLGERGAESYIIGGYVRDLFAGRNPHDVDIALAGDSPIGAARAVANALGGSVFILDEERGYARALVPLPAGGEPISVDFTPLQGTLGQDLARRDFTIDAMALPMLPTGELGALVDPWQGRQDLERRVVRCLSEEVLLDDPGRLLRAVRLAGEFGFHIEIGTAGLIRAFGHKVREVSGERVRDEFMRILELDTARDWLWEMDRLGLLTEVLPELESARGVEQPREHYWDVFEHCLEAVGFFSRLLDAGERRRDSILSLVPWHPMLDAYFSQDMAGGRTRRTLTKLACLLHDVAKPQTKTIEPSGRMRFFGHPEQGAATAGQVMERLRFSRREAVFVEKAIEEHLRPMQLSQDLAPPTRRALYRYYRDLGEAGLATLYVSLADYLAARGPRLEIEDWRAHTEYISVALAAGTDEQAIIAPAPLVDGHVLMRELGLAPGPLVGRLLAMVQEAMAVGDVRTVDEAVALARRTMAEERGPADTGQEG